MPRWKSCLTPNSSMELQPVFRVEDSSQEKEIPCSQPRLGGACGDTATAAEESLRESEPSRQAAEAAQSELEAVHNLPAAPSKIEAGQNLPAQIDGMQQLGFDFSSPCFEKELDEAAKERTNSAEEEFQAV